MANARIPPVRRMLYGFVMRQGMRRRELASLSWDKIGDAGEVLLDEKQD